MHARVARATLLGVRNRLSRAALSERGERDANLQHEHEQRRCSALPLNRAAKEVAQLHRDNCTRERLKALSGWRRGRTCTSGLALRLTLERDRTLGGDCGAPPVQKRHTHSGARS